MWLVCRTTDLDDAYVWARLEMTPEVAILLSSYRRLWDHVHNYDARLYALEFFNCEVEYGRRVTGAGAAAITFEDDIVGFWKSVPVLPELEVNDVAASTLKVIDDGVLWSASPKHGEGYFETPTIYWGDLDEVAQGRDPFGLMAPPGSDGE